MMNTLEQDILKEIFNISLAKAADSFAKISKEEVLINVPDILILKEEKALSQIIENKKIDIIVQSEIKGDIYGQTLLLFSYTQVSELSKATKVPVNVDDKKFQNSLILEVSNILTGTLVTHLANILKLNIYGSVPHEPISRDKLDPKQLLLDMDISRPILVTINTLFIRSNNKIEFPLMLIFDVPNLNKVLGIIRKVNIDNKLLIRK